jgi:ubiquinone/menaquinone biosynthesis C-methylase UbiE
MTLIASQVRQPRGILGWLLGRVLAYLHDGPNRKAVELLDVRSTDRVLEIGIGQGKTLEQLARRAHDGFVAGIEFSAVLVRQARWRNQQLIRAGRLEVKLASVSNIPYPNAEFDKVCAINTYPFWPEPEEDLQEVRRVLRPGGGMVLAVPASESDRSPGCHRLGLTPEQVGAIERLVRQAGFREVELRVQKVRFMTAANLLAKK